MSQRDRRAALRAVQAAADDADGKLRPPVSEAANGTPPEAEPVPPAPVAAAADAEELLPEAWRERIDDANRAEAVDVHGERVRRRVDESMVYLAVRVPRSLRDAIRRRAERLDVSMQEFVVSAAQMMLEATARAADRD